MKKCLNYNYAIIFTILQQLMSVAGFYISVPKTFKSIKKLSEKHRQKNKNLFVLILQLRNYAFYKFAMMKNRGFIESNM